MLAGCAVLVAGCGNSSSPPATRSAPSARPAARPARASAVPRPGRIPRPLSATDVYAAGRPGMLSPRVRERPRPRLRPQLAVEHGRRDQPAHGEDRRPLRGRAPAPARDAVVGPAHAVGHQRHRQQPHAGEPAHEPPGRPVPVLDPYNLYFTADGRRAIVVAEAHRELDFRTPHTMKLTKALKVPAVRRHRPHGLHGRRAPRAGLVRVRRADGRRRPAARARGQDDRAAAPARCPRT